MEFARMTSPLSSGSGGGLTPAYQESVITTPFSSGLGIPLGNVPDSQAAIIVNYNGQVIRPDVDWELVGLSAVTLLFGDDPTNYDPAQCVVGINYWYSA